MDRFQYRIVNLGVFNTAGRMVESFGRLGSVGRDLVGIYDKSSNWIGGAEKGYALFKRVVPEGVEPDGLWAELEKAADAGDQAGFNPGSGFCEREAAVLHPSETTDAGAFSGCVVVRASTHQHPARLAATIARTRASMSQLLARSPCSEGTEWIRVVRWTRAGCRLFR